MTQQRHEVFLFCTKFDQFIWERLEGSQCITRLPADMQNRNARFLRWQDKAANLLGKLILLWGFERLNLKNRFNLNDIKYTEHQRPYIADDVDFSISQDRKST